MWRRERKITFKITNMKINGELWQIFSSKIAYFRILLNIIGIDRPMQLQYLLEYRLFHRRMMADSPYQSDGAMKTYHGHGNGSNQENTIDFEWLAFDILAFLIMLLGKFWCLPLTRLRNFSRMNGLKIENSMLNKYELLTMWTDFKRNDKASCRSRNIY